MTACELNNIEKINALFKNALLLTIEETASVLRTTGANVHKMRERGHVPFSTVRIGARHFFPVSHLATWLCGGLEEQPMSIKLPTRTPSRVRSKSEFLSRLDILKKQIANCAVALKEEDLQGVALKNQIEALSDHLDASSQLIAHIERDSLRAQISL